jgi:hypothetical protein
MSNKYYSILVGGKKPQEVEVGFLDKNTGLPKGKTDKATIAIGSVSIPNYSSVWAKLEEKQGKLTGEIEFLTWGAAGGSATEIRYLPNCKSLSKQYQEQVAKLNPGENDMEIILKIGVNDFNRDTQGGLIKMLEHHSLNSDNSSRDPLNENIIFSNHDPKSRVAKKTTEISERNTATGIVLLAKEDAQTLLVLAEIFGLDPKRQSGDLEEELLTRADEKSKTFNLVLSNAKSKARQLLDKAASYNLLDAKTAQGEIHYTDGSKREKLFVGIDEEAKDKFAFVVDSYLSPATFNAFKILDKKVKSYEKDRME